MKIIIFVDRTSAEIWYYIPEDQERGDELPVLIVPKKELEGGNNPKKKPDVH